MPRFADYDNVLSPDFICDTCVHCSDESHAAVAAVAVAASQTAILFVRALPFLTCYSRCRRLLSDEYN